MMMTNNKKMAMSIIKASGAGKEPSQGSDAHYVDKGDGPKVSVEIEAEEPKLDASMGMEAAMAKFMLAVGAKDAKKAAQALCEFMDMHEEQEDSSENGALEE